MKAEGQNAVKELTDVDSAVFDRSWHSDRPIRKSAADDFTSTSLNFMMEENTIVCSYLGFASFSLS